MTSLINKIPPEVTEAVGKSLELLRGARFRLAPGTAERSLSLPSLLERCEDLIARHEQSTREPIRLIHHFACTGGTLITKCLACSPNVQVLSEVDPLSSMLSQKSKFNPTDLVQLLEHGNRGASREDKLALFRAAFGVLYNSAERKGLRLLVRDHTHSHFCTSDKIESRPTLGQILSDQFETRAIITVRHPLDSWLSLVNNGWVTYQPNTLDEYCRRYRAFLGAYPEICIFKYEDFVGRPERVLNDMCKELGLRFAKDFKALFMAQTFSGDSGRKGSTIKLRERRAVSEDFLVQARESTVLRLLCENLHYEI